MWKQGENRAHRKSTRKVPRFMPVNSARDFHPLLSMSAQIWRKNRKCMKARSSKCGNHPSINPFRVVKDCSKEHDRHNAFRSTQVIFLFPNSQVKKHSSCRYAASWQSHAAWSPLIIIYLGIKIEMEGGQPGNKRQCYLFVCRSMVEPQREASSLCAEGEEPATVVMMPP